MKSNILTHDDYDEIITIGLYDWYFYYTPNASESLDINTLELQKKSRLKFNQLIKEIIDLHPNYFFFLRRHPGSTGIDYYDGIEGLSTHSNVKIIQSELSLIDNIDVSDYWLSYDSTTALEAMVRGKKVANIRPVFLPNDLRIVSNEIVESITEIESFKDFIARKQDDLSTNLIELEYFFGNLDGLNHVRAGNEIIRLINTFNNNKDNVDRVCVHETWEKILIFKISTYAYLFPFIPKFIKEKSYLLSRLMAWDQRNLLDFEEIRLKHQLQYYERLGFDIKTLRDI
jgi:hypothetical protein